MIEVKVPGDKSLTHRALIFSAVATGESRLLNALSGEDCRSTAAALRALGIEVPDLSSTGGEIRIVGRGLQGLKSPIGELDLGNSGTTTRLLLGILAGQEGLRARLTGDASLRARPMRRVTGPLGLMGARFVELGEADRLPLEVTGGALRSIDFPSPVASAQVKSALLLAGLAGGVPVFVTEPRCSRDHTERLLGSMGARTVSHRVQEGWRVELRDPPESINPLDFRIPGDFSSAAFLVALAILGGSRDSVVLPGIGLNPGRTGLLRVLERMGVGEGMQIHSDSAPSGVAEPTGTLVASPTGLRGCRIEGAEIPDLIDEIPVLAALAARAEGRTTITGAGELRVKESDRIHALVRNLARVGVTCEELPDGLSIEGSDKPLKGGIRSFGDHRIAMAFGILGALPGNRIEVDEPRLAEVSFPGFWKVLRTMSRTPEDKKQSLPRSSGRRRPVVTIDGPAGSGKSTTAKAVAQRLSFRHLDSGAIYRALTLALLERDVPSDEWAGLDGPTLGSIPIHLVSGAESFGIALGDRVLEEELRTPEVTGFVSHAAKVPAVRDRLLELQREAGREGGLVADGRDMGSVVFPDAEVKIFLVADLEERARRRLLQSGALAPTPSEVDAEANRIRTRDRLDSERQASPLTRPEGAIDLDTTHLSFDQQVDAIVECVRELTRT